MRLMSHLIGHGPAPLLAAGVMAAGIALSAGTQAVAVPPAPAPVTGTITAGMSDRRA